MATHTHTHTHTHTDTPVHTHTHICSNTKAKITSLIPLFTLQSSVVLNRQLRQADAGSVLHTSVSNSAADAGRTQVSSWIQTGCTRRQNVLTLADGERERDKKKGGSSQGGTEPRTSPPTHLCLPYLALSLLPFKRPLLDLIYSRDAALIHIYCF